MTTSVNFPSPNVVSARHELSRPFLEHLHFVEAEAYHMLENISSPYQILKKFSPTKEQRALHRSFFSKIYYFLVGMHEDVRHNISDHQHKLIAKSHNLVTHCHDLPIHENLKEEFDAQLALVTESQVSVLDHIQDINAMRCFIKLGLTTLTSVLSLILTARIYFDSSYCSMTHVVEDIQKSYNAKCPSISNTQYYFSLLSTYVLAPYFIANQVINRVKDNSILNIFLENPVDNSLDTCKRLSLGALMRISHIKNRILTLIQTTPDQ